MPIFERFGGRLVKVEADDLFIVFLASARSWPSTVLRCMRACNGSASTSRRTRRSSSPRASSPPDVPIAWLDVFGGVVPLSRIGEDEAPNGMLYVHESVKDRLDRMGEGACMHRQAAVFEEAATIEGDMCDGRQHKLYTVKVGQGAVTRRGP